MSNQAIHKVINARGYSAAVSSQAPKNTYRGVMVNRQLYTAAFLQNAWKAIHNKYYHGRFVASL
jgi:hypothetical protein